MLKIPAIDIIDGKVVRLSKGEYDSVKNYGNTPLEQAKIFNDQGFEWLHVVDLSGSKDGNINTLKIIEDIKKFTKLKLEFGGGIRSKVDVLRLSEFGVDKIIVGSMSVNNKSEFESIFDKINPAEILIASDILNYTVRIKGWTEDSQIHIFDHIDYCKTLGIENFLCTDIAVDGMLTGPSIHLYKEIIAFDSNVKLTASGGVSKMEDVIELSKLPIRGVVIGKAIYENKIDMKELAEIAL